MVACRIQHWRSILVSHFHSILMIRYEFLFMDDASFDGKCKVKFFEFACTEFRKVPSGGSVDGIVAS